MCPEGGPRTGNRMSPGRMGEKASGGAVKAPARPATETASAGGGCAKPEPHREGWSACPTYLSVSSLLERRVSKSSEFLALVTFQELRDYSQQTVIRSESPDVVYAGQPRGRAAESTGRAEGRPRCA